MIIIFNGNSCEIEDGMTLAQFVRQQNASNQAFLINGEAVDSSTVLTSYNVIEADVSGTRVTQDRVPTNVDVNLSDFTGQSGIVNVSNNAEDLRSRYSTDVVISVIRDNSEIQTSELQTGDMIMVTPSGGVSGAI